MSEISIYDYLEEIDTLITEGDYATAAAHCQHILKRYPRHIDTYRMLGKSLLEQQDYGGALDIFNRVLSTDPEDFVAHVAMSIIYRDDLQLSEALWHMERAFEIDPYNEAIQHQLRDLYRQRDGDVPVQLPLTRGALARLYARGYLYQQAAAELRRTLEDNPGRVDLQTLLAEILWRDDQRVDAVEICIEILRQLPNSIKANAILTDVWLMSGRIEEAQEYIQQLQALVLLAEDHVDRETPAGRALTGLGAPPLMPSILIEPLDNLQPVSVASGSATSNELSFEDSGSDSWLDLDGEGSSVDGDDWLAGLDLPDSVDWDQGDDEAEASSIEFDFLGDEKGAEPSSGGGTGNTDWLFELDDEDSSNNDDDGWLAGI
ncbi:MAG TPA: tetratricopeptide repeat protein [Anaerolineae bacterium]|nr:tetratricopeptide repeat protein [Anaerolineae bacterium]